MSVVFTKSNKIPEGGNIVEASGAQFLVGTLTFAGSYATGGDTFTGSTPETLGRIIGAGRVLGVMTGLRGYTAEWNDTTKKLLLHSAGVELAAAAYPAGLTATPVPVVFLVR
jgi:hypothetical protein